MYYIETLIFIISISYSVNKNVPFSTYGENVFLFGQTIIIIFLIWFYNREIGIGHKLLVFVFFSAAGGYLLGGFAPAEYLNHLISSVNFLMLISRVPQFYKNFTNKSTGTLSFINYFLNFVGCSA